MDKQTLMREDRDIEQAIEWYGSTVWRVCVLYFGQSADAQDAFQETLLKYACDTTEFSDQEHQKAWLIRVATNVCKDMLKAAHRRTLSLDVAENEWAAPQAQSSESPGSRLSEALQAIRDLKDPPRTPVYLALYEGYSAPEIAVMLDAPVNTVYSWIARGKSQLREVLR